MSTNGEGLKFKALYKRVAVPGHVARRNLSRSSVNNSQGRLTLGQIKGVARRISAPNTRTEDPGNWRIGRLDSKQSTTPLSGVTMCRNSPNFNLLYFCRNFYRIHNCLKSSFKKLANKHLLSLLLNCFKFLENL